MLPSTEQIECVIMAVKMTDATLSDYRLGKTQSVLHGLTKLQPITNEMKHYDLKCNKFIHKSEYERLKVKKK